MGKKIGTACILIINGIGILCYFYRYNPETGSLTELYYWDGVDITGIALPKKDALWNRK